MAVKYVPVAWNQQKLGYDKVMLSLIGLYLVLFTVLQVIFYPEVRAETLIIRATGTLAFFILHVILSIGPLARINKRFLPLLYNRRHLGVTMFLFALIHGVFNIIQFHALGDTNPLVSIFTANLHYGTLVNFPFQSLGFFALIILFLMASTSHDFWLKNLSPRVWKSLHMMVYVAYGLILMHVMLGVIQLEQSPGWVIATGLGMITLIGLHLAAGIRERKNSKSIPTEKASDFVEVCKVDEIEENRAKVTLIEGQNIAIFKYNGQLSAVSNICRHQNGPLGEGKIVDGCITCPWHGYQYLPENGQSPPPFTEKLETYDVQVKEGKVWVNPKPYPEGTARPPAVIDS